MQKYNGMPVEYCGDGVYALYTGYGVELRANDHANPTNTIFLEPGVLKAINNFYKQCKKEANQ